MTSGNVKRKTQEAGHLERERDRAAGDRPAIGVKSGIAGYFGVSSISKKKACLEYYKNESYK